MNKTFLLILTLLAISCSSPSKESQRSAENVKEVDAENKIPDIEKGKVVNPVHCVSDASQSYAAYLPSSYTTTKKYPVLFFFDAHAGGRIPVEAYQTLAEKYSYVLVASNNSKNGMDANTLSSIAATFMNDVKNRFAVDEKRIYLSGFSGGARVAASVALQGGVCGLACCSAGFQPGTTLPFSFIGFAGSEDFNSNEMIALDKLLAQNQSRHQLILYEGKHEWPSALVFENAFLWFEFNAMKENLIAVNQTFIVDFKSKETAEIKSIQAKGKVYDAYLSADKCLNFVAGLSDCSSLLSIKNNLEKSPEFIKISAEKSSIEKREKDLLNYYRQAFQEKDFGWWNAEINNLIAQSKSNKNSREENLMFKRSLSFLSLMCYMASNSTLNQNQLPQAAMYLQLYEKVDPQNSEVYYMQALLAAKQQNTNGIIPALLKAENTGFADFERLDKESLFSLIHQEEAFKNLLDKLKSKK